MYRKLGTLLNLFVALSMVLALFAAGPSVQPAVAQGPSGPGEVRFLTGSQPGEPLDIAMAYIRAKQASLGLTDADLSDVIVKDQYVSSHTGVTHIYLRQRYQGIEVATANINISVARNGSIINMGGGFVSNLEKAVNLQTPVKSAAQSIQAAASYLGLDMTDAPVLQRSTDSIDKAAVFSQGSISTRAIPVKLVYHVVKTGVVRLAWNLEIEEFSGLHYWSMNVDAENDQILGQVDYVDSDNWETPAAKSGESSTSSGAIYNVFAIPNGTPSMGDRSMVAPEDALSSPYGWHDTDGVAGPEYTVTRGNNVYAATDWDADNVPDTGSSPDGGSSLVFNFPFDPTQAPETYSKTAVTNLFYWNNIAHDVLYRYGFDEPAGNFQTNNYSNGGLEGDYVFADAQDGSGVNNANFGTPPDGQNPRMQMFIWQDPGIYNLIVSAPPTMTGEYNAPPAAFGPDGNYDLTSDTVIADPLDGCAAITNGAAVAGKIALIQRGACNFSVKVKNAQDVGAIGVIVLQNYANRTLPPITMGCTTGCDAITIPSVMVGYADGQSFLVYPPTVRIYRIIGVDRDSDLDAEVMIHEYSHGLSNRLVGGPANVGCLNNAEQMGEGWSDFTALALTDKNTIDARGVGTYLQFEPLTGPGIRPYRYSTDMSINPDTFSALGTQYTGVHDVGYLFGVMLWEVYKNLVTKYGFNPNIYDDWSTGGNNLALQLVVDGMKYAPCNPGFVDARNGILAADMALTGGENYCEIWDGFAKRGLGYSAEQGDSNVLTDQTEAFDVPPSCAASAAEVSPASLQSTQSREQLVNKTLDLKNVNDVGENSQVTTQGTVHQDVSEILTDTVVTVTNGASINLYFTITETMFLDITTSNPTDTGADVDLEVYDSADNQVAGSGNSSSDEHVLMILPPDDTYRVKLIGYAVPAGSTGLDLVVTLTRSPDSGLPISYFWTTTTVTDTHLLEVSTGNSANNSNIDLYVLDPNDRMIGSSIFLEDEEAVKIGMPEPGEYTILVTGPNVPSGTDTFDLTVKQISGFGRDLTWVAYDTLTTCATPVDAPWAAATPIQGAAEPGLYSHLSVQFNSMGVAAGTYNGTLCIATNDPAHAMIEVPLTLEVQEVLPQSVFLPLVTIPPAPK